MRGRFSRVPGRASCGLWLAASHKGTFVPISTWSCTLMGVGHGPGLAAGSEHWENTQVQILDSQSSIRAQASVVPGLVTWGLPCCGSKSPLPFPPNPWEINPLVVAREDPRKLASAASIPAIQRSIHTPTHPSIPKFLRCPGGPMTQCYSSLGRPAHGCSGLGCGIRHREHKLPRAAAVYSWVEPVHNRSPPRNNKTS